jgi:hypothetical protein
VNNVKRVAFVVLAEDRGAGLEIHPLDPRRKLFELVGLQSLEECYTRETFRFMAQALTVV